MQTQITTGIGLITLLGLILAAPCAAYVGPGAGLSLLGALWGLLVAVGAALAFIVLWPLRRWRRRRQAATHPPADDPAAESQRNAGPQ